MARTGQDGARGISAFILEKGMEGLDFGPDEIKMGWHAQPTRQVIMENVRVPVENLVGEEGEGFKAAMCRIARRRPVGTGKGCAVPG